jgi:hypothetical protein
MATPFIHSVCPPKDATDRGRTHACKCRSGYNNGDGPCMYSYLASIRQGFLSEGEKDSGSERVRKEKGAV